MGKSEALKFQVTGLGCAACVQAVERAVNPLPGVERAEVNLLMRTLTVSPEGEPGDAERKQLAARIEKAVKAAGYKAREADSEEALSSDPENQTELAQLKKRLLVSVLFLLPLMYVSMGHMLGAPLPAFFHGGMDAAGGGIFSGSLPGANLILQGILTLPIVAVNRKFFITGFRMLVKRSPNMDSLIAVGVTASFLFFYFESAGMILTLVTLGKFLEARSKGRTGQAIRKLMELAPKQATVLRDKDGRSVEETVPVSEVKEGDILLIRPGETIGVDCVVISGETYADESALTGESMPAEKTPGSLMLSASVNLHGAVRCRAVRVGKDTTLAQIIRLVEEASASKAPIAKLADRISGVFVPVVMGISFVTLLVWILTGAGAAFSVSTAVAVLVISCPCALGLATPVAIMAATGKGAEHGILIKQAEALERLGEADTVVLDKTGTVTEGKPVVTDFFWSERLNGETLSRERALLLAAAIESGSEHPLAGAVLEAAARLGGENSGGGSRQEQKEGADADGALSGAKAVPEKNILPERFEAVAGRGVRCRLEGGNYAAGNQVFLEEEGIFIPETGALSGATAASLLSEGKTCLFFADSDEKNLFALAAVADAVRSTSPDGVEDLRRLGTEPVLLTGDHRLAAEAVGKQLGIASIRAEVLPGEKEGEIRRLQEEGKRVIMVGDGINDAPAITRAHVGIAVGAAADIAVESADVVLMKTDLRDVGKAIRLSRKTLTNIRQNLFWAFFYNALGIPLAAGVFYPVLGWTLNPMFAAAAMSLSSVCVVTNALRLKRISLDAARP